MDLGITQKEAARLMGADQWTVINWEKGRTEPAARYVPRIVRFLGHDPFPRGTTLAQRLRAARRARGLSHRALARELGIDPTTLLGWEQGRHRPSARYGPQILRLLGQAKTPGA
jgi:transcriptional regulator with XRE-family HTH domain